MDRPSLVRRVNKETPLGCIGDQSGIGAVASLRYTLAGGVGQVGCRCRTGGEEFVVGCAACCGWKVVGLPIARVGGYRQSVGVGQGVVAWSWGRRCEWWHYLV